jgi:2-amino-4-hydroxy-6-hydroxymethyldihydropteridine diphosphokinase
VGRITRKVAIALGSNLGDRRAAIAFAAERLSPVISSLSLSEIIETEPQGEGLLDQPPYLNAVLVGETRLSARALLEYLLATEQACGRERSYQGAPRTLDLDLVLFGDALIDEPDLKVPHPRFRDRYFVLGPLAEVAPDLRDPVTGLTAGELLDRWKKAGT